jgi:hypothetical protein
MKSARYLLIGIMSLASFQVLLAQDRTGANAAALRQALAELREHPEDVAAQRKYLAAFPGTYEKFLAFFGENQELSENSYEYVNALSDTAEKNESAVGNLLIRLSTDAHYDADAPSSLQHATAAFGAHHSQAFAKLLKDLPPAKRTHVITFLADVENFSTYTDYQLIIDNLRSGGDSSLASQFVAARQRRSHQH